MRALIDDILAVKIIQKNILVFSTVVNGMVLQDLHTVEPRLSEPRLSARSTIRTHFWRFYSVN